VDAVALAATIGGSAVGLAGVGVTAWSIRQQRASAKELAALQHGHERDLARGARLFERRSVVYEGLLTILQLWMERVEATEPILRMAGEPEPPDPPSPDELRVMNARLRTFGSPAVADAYEAFMDAIRGFWGYVMSLRMTRDQGGANLPWQELQDARAKVREALSKLERLVSDELASL
jgi:hypothetical protein